MPAPEYPIPEVRWHSAAAASRALRRPRCVTVLPERGTEPHDDRGFTLIELIAVIMLTGFVMYAVYSVLFSTLQAQQEVDDTVAVYEVGPQIVELIVRDLQSAAYGLVEDDKGLKGGIKNVGGVDTSVIDLITTQDSRTARLKNDVPYHSDITEIGYQIRQSDEYPGLFELYRREDWGVDDQPLLGSLLHKVYDRVKEFRLEYVEKGKEDAETYEETWDTADKKRLPRAIYLRLTIQVGDPEILADLEDGAGEYTFERMIVLPGGDDTPEGQGGSNPPPGR